jgi:hypothetical protein
VLTMIDGVEVTRIFPHTRSFYMGFGGYFSREVERSETDVQERGGFSIRVFLRCCEMNSILATTDSLLVNPSPVSVLLSSPEWTPAL